MRGIREATPEEIQEKKNRETSEEICEWKIVLKNLTKAFLNDFLEESQKELQE